MLNSTGAIFGKLAQQMVNLLSSTMYAALAFTLLLCSLSVQESGAKTFSQQTEMSTTRYGHTMTLLPNGKVLIAGGYDNSKYLNSAEIYDPVTGTVKTTKNMTAARMNHSATLMVNGKVLLLGGRNGTATVDSAEVFDPDTGKFTNVTDTLVGRIGHSATLLPNGKVLIAGGSKNNAYIGTAEVFDPETKKSTELTGMAAQRTGSTATPLANGKILIVGGKKDSAYVNTVELFDPITGIFTTLENLSIERFSHTSTLLTDGRVLIAGGRTSGGISSSAVIFDPATESFSTALAMASERDDHIATLMPDGTVLIAGGRSTSGYLNTAEVFDPETAIFMPTANMTSTRDISSAILLPNGNVLVAGGWNGNSATCSGEIFNPQLPNTMHRLHFNSAGEGRVPVTLSPGRDCSGSCNRFYQQGTVVTLTPQFDSSSYVFGWSGCDSVNSNRACIVTMTSDRHVKLKISEEDDDAEHEYTITATAGENGSITPPGASLVHKGESITYTITPASGYHIAEVAIDGRRELGPVTSYTFTKVKKPHTISATFAADCVVTITASDDSNGIISPKGEVSVPCGSSPTFSMTPNTLFLVKDVIVDGSSVGALSTYTFSNIGTVDHTISATFAPAIISYTIIATANSGGTVTPAGSSIINKGDSLLYTITPAPGFKVADVLVDNASVGAVDTYTFSTVEADHTITVSFSPIVYTVTATAGANGSITPSGTSNVNHGDSLLVTITPAAGFKVADVLVDNVSVGAVATYTFSNVTSTHTISATFSPIAFNVSATPGVNGSITPSGISSVNQGESITYLITPSAGFKVADVLVDNDSAGAVATYTFSNVTADHNISATFSPIVYTISATAGANGTVTPAGPVSVNHGSIPTYTITPAEGFKVADVLVDNNSVGAVTTYTFSGVIANHDISATFTPIVYTITATAEANGTIDPAGPSSINHGAGLSYAITAAEGFKVADVLVDTVSVGAVTTHAFSSVTADHIISATFTPIVYTITATTGANGTVTPLGPSSVNHGAGLSFAITPAAGYKITDVLVDNVSVGAVTSYDFSNVTADHAISATFSKIVYTVTATAGANGSVTPAGPSSVDHGADSPAYTITPATGFKIADVLVDGASIGAATTHTFSNVTAAHTISATFTPIVYTLTATAGVNGSITPSGASSLNHGSSITYTITPAPGYKVADILVDNASIGTVTTYTFSNVTADHSILVSFTPLVVNVDYFVITATPGANGTMNPSGAVQALTGQNTTIAIIPAPGFKVNQVKVDGGANLGPITSYTFNNVTANHTITATFSAVTYKLTPIYDNTKGTVTPSGQIFVAYNAGYSCSAKPNAGYHVSDTLIDGVSVGAQAAYSFSNMMADHTIEFRFAENPTIIITATAGVGGNITPAGAVPVISGMNQTFSIVPDTGYRIGNVVVDGVSKGTVASYTFSKVTAVPHTISATFIADFYTITASATGNGTITPAGVTTLSPGVTSPVYTITPAEGYKANVKIDGVSQGNISTYTFANVTANHTISVDFTVITYKITPTAGENGTMTPSGFIFVNHGSGYTWYITPTPGYSVQDVLVDGTSVGQVTTYAFSNVTAEHTIEASFVANQSITITATAGANGNISPSGVISALSGSNPFFTITADAGYRVADVIVDGVSKGAKPNYTFTSVSAINHTIDVTFMLDEYTITATAGANGSISPAGVHTVAKGGTSPNFIITPDLGFKTNLAIDGIGQGPLTSFTFTNVTAYHTIAASFVPLTFKITPVHDNTKGSMTPVDAIYVNYGQGYSCSFTPNDGYHVEDVLVDGVSVGAVTAYSFSNVITDRTIEVRFAENPIITIEASAGANGSISPSGNVPAVSGTSPTFTMIPVAGYRVADVVVDGVSKGAVPSYTFSKVSAVNHTISVSFIFDTYIITASAGANGTIEPEGVTNINKGADSPVFSITPALGYKANVVVDGISQGNIPTYTFTNVTANHTIAASFSPLTYKITPVYDNTKGSMTPSEAIFVSHGGGYPVSIRPDLGYHVANVLLDGVSIGAVTSYTFENVTAAHTIEAIFAENPSIIINASAGINGAIDPTGPVSVVSGTNPVFNMMPAAGYRVEEVIVDTVSKGAINSYTFSKVTAEDHTISVSFTLDTYTIVATAEANGTITYQGSTVVNGGESKTYNITANANYRILNVQVDGVYIGAVSSHTFDNISGDHTITATFELQ